MNNTAIIAAAGSGKTTYLVKKALAVTPRRILITTFTNENVEEIRKTFLTVERGLASNANTLPVVPSHVDILPWFTFLLKHLVRPYQSKVSPQLKDCRIGFSFVAGMSAQGIAEKDVLRHYFDSELRIYSDKIAKFACKAIACNEMVLDRLRQIYSGIYIDEAQDLAGWDLDIVKLLMQNMDEIVLVGDPRQYIYETHKERKNKHYQKGNFVKYLQECVQPRTSCSIDTKSLAVSHRNGHAQCTLSSSLFPHLPPSIPCSCPYCRQGEEGAVFAVLPEDVEEFLHRTRAVQLRMNATVKCHSDYPSMNIGKSKGKTLQNVLIYPTDDMQSWLFSNAIEMADSTKARLYVALTRANGHTGIVLDYRNKKLRKPICQFKPVATQGEFDF